MALHLQSVFQITGKRNLGKKLGLCCIFHFFLLIENLQVPAFHAGNGNIIDMHWRAETLFMLFLVFLKPIIYKDPLQHILGNQLINNQNCTFKCYQASAYRQKLEVIDCCPFPNNGAASYNKEEKLNLLSSRMFFCQNCK